MNLGDCMMRIQQLEAQNRRLVDEVLATAQDAEFYLWLRDPLNIQYVADMIDVQQISTASDVDATVRRELTQ